MRLFGSMSSTCVRQPQGSPPMGLSYCPSTEKPREFHRRDSPSCRFPCGRCQSRWTRSSGAPGGSRRPPARWCGCPGNCSRTRAARTSRRVCAESHPVADSRQRACPVLARSACCLPNCRPAATANGAGRRGRGCVSGRPCPEKAPWVFGWLHAIASCRPRYRRKARAQRVYNVWATVALRVRA